MLDEGVHWMQSDKVVPKMQFGTAQTLFFRSREGAGAGVAGVGLPEHRAGLPCSPPPVDGKIAIPTWKSELYFEYHRGVMTTQANHKRNMRESGSGR